MSTRSKGTAFQNWLALWLGSYGWQAENFPPGGRWQKKRDVFGCDIVAKHHSTGYTLWIQATADPKVNILRKLRRMAPVHWNPLDIVLLAIRRKPNRIALFRVEAGMIQDAGWIKVETGAPRPTGTYITPEDVKPSGALEVLSRLFKMKRTDQIEERAKRILETFDIKKEGGMVEKIPRQKPWPEPPSEKGEKK